VFGRPLVTTVDPLKGFYAGRGTIKTSSSTIPATPTIVVHDLPKLEALKNGFPARYRDQPVTVKSAN
jgi:peptide-methionine (S)-S-oxide reductase